MNGSGYEEKCARYLSAQGFHHVELTRQSGDQGIDVLASRHGIKYGFQCKYYTGSVGNHAVMEAFAGAKYYKCHRAVVMTNSEFTHAAEKLSAETGVVLWPSCKARTGIMGALIQPLRKVSALLVIMCMILMLWTIWKNNTLSSVTMEKEGWLLIAVIGSALLRLLLGRSRLCLLAAVIAEGWAAYRLIQMPIVPPYPLTSEHLYLSCAVTAFVMAAQWICQLGLSPVPAAVRRQL